MRVLLAPLALLYGAVVALRNFFYERGVFKVYRSSLRVICVGNVSAGGSAKSPFVAELVRRFEQRGKKVVVLLRGYGGSSAGPLLVERKHTSKEVGDEALMHFESLPQAKVVISRSRVAGAKFIEDKALGELIVMDDGFQHRALEREQNFLLLDATDSESVALWQAGHLLPWGRLREPLTAALKRATALVFTYKRGPLSKEQQVNPRLPAQAGVSAARLPQVSAFFTLGSARQVLSGERLELSELRDKKVALISAIASGRHLMRSLKEAGISLSSSVIKSDHAQFSVQEWQALSAEVELVICTAKDLVKLRELDIDSAKLWVLELKAEVAGLEEIL